MAEHPINNLMQTTLQKIKELVDASTVVGDPIVVGSATIIPVSKISYGFASGGSDLPAKKEGELFGGGGGAGATVAPVGFIVITENDVKLLQVEENRNSASKLIDMVPGLIDKVKESLGKKKEQADEQADDMLPIDEPVVTRGLKNKVRVNPRDKNNRK